MPTVSVYNLNGTVVGEQALNPKVFAVPVKPVVVQQVVVGQQANSRQVLAHTKTKGEVRGGGRKPWKQKGTGRARQGSIRNPQWRGGGVTFGPRNNRNFSFKVNQRLKHLAVRMVLSDKVEHDRMVVVDHLQLSSGKTKQLRAALAKLPVASHPSVLATGTLDTNVVQAAANLPNVNCIAPNSLNVVDLLRYDYLVLDQAAIDQLEKLYA